MANVFVSIARFMANAIETKQKEYFAPEQFRNARWTEKKPADARRGARFIWKINYLALIFAQLN